MLHMPYLNAGTFECGKLESFAAGVFNLCPYLSGDWSRDSEEYISAVPNSNFGYFRPKFLRQSKLEILSWLEISFSLYCFINILFVMICKWFQVILGRKVRHRDCFDCYRWMVEVIHDRGHPWPSWSIYPQGTSPYFSAYQVQTWWTFHELLMNFSIQQRFHS